MELPSTRPSGRNPTSRTSRNSLTDRSEVKIEPALPGSSSARRRMASCGTPAASSSVAMFPCSVMASPTERFFEPWLLSYPYPARLAALRVERHNGQRLAVLLFRAGEAGDRGADGRGLHDVIPAALHRRALPFPHLHLHGGDHQNLGVTCAPAGLADGQPVIVP